ncbi:MAG: hypothetical protein H6633_11655 [Anaerolineales bacterium]|nr:hypothetical protein [Anaerolineales bacterium]
MQQEQADPPNWKQAEQAMNSLVSLLLPDDEEANFWLAETRIRQGNWYLAQPNQSAVQSRHGLQKSGRGLSPRLKDLAETGSLVTPLKENFRAYQQRQQAATLRPGRWLYRRCRFLIELLPDDRQVERWLVEAYLEQGSGCWNSRQPNWPKPSLTWPKLNRPLGRLWISCPAKKRNLKR